MPSSSLPEPALMTWRTLLALETSCVRAAFLWLPSVLSSCRESILCGSTQDDVLGLELHSFLDLGRPDDEFGGAGHDCGGEEFTLLELSLLEAIALPFLAVWMRSSESVRNHHNGMTTCR